MSTKTYEIRPNQSIELLKELHILTRDGKMNQDSRRKLKQVYHLFQFIEPLLADVEREKGGVTLVDHGAGKSYLGFILYDLFFKARAPIRTSTASKHARNSWRVRPSSPRGSASAGCRS
ncbi:SAM-dependent methyltransferase [Burkholderia pseudomallei]|nr:methyltransferase domain protein [Burkholderia pseudomallei]CAK0206652.1 methyltransferase domain protein [Burkholderia pseudomallei]CAK0530224.1 methyltransferase domain protein [Burkholderia pseudomallei]CAK0569272.1 methyltransferase domain protein [Burkholderia pseudomallei]VBE00509.1 SAM-dependent methyltransferase [Burkholderia pseudomallei]